MSVTNPRIDPESKPNLWLSLVPVVPIKRHNVIANVMLVVAACLISLQLYLIRRDVEASRSSEPPPIQLTEWLPDKKEYDQGSQVRFTYNRTVYTRDGLGTVPVPGHVLVILQVDSFENLDTGETYPGWMLTRFIDRTGTDKVRSIRSLPLYMTPGTYVLKGWMFAYTSVRSLPAYYSSKPFRVKPSSKQDAERPINGPELAGSLREQKDALSTREDPVSAGEVVYAGTWWTTCTGYRDPFYGGSGER